jgi:hypothetical protein
MMTCISTPELDDMELLKYLDKAASSDVMAHIDNCLYCQERASQLQQFQNRLSHRLHRAECPSGLELGEYHLNMLDAQSIATIRKHISTCPHCRRELEQLNDFLDILTPQAKQPPLQQIQVLVAHLIKSTVQPFDNLAGSTLAPAMGGLRDGSDEEHSSVYRINDVEIVLEIQSELPISHTRTILGFVRGMKADKLDVYLWEGEHPIVAVEVDQQGHFIFESVPAGRYDLTVRGSDLEVHVREINL